MRKFLILAFSMLMITTSATLPAEKEKLPFTLGIYGGMNFNFHSPLFYYKDNLSNFLEFSSNKTNTGLNIGAIALFPINETFVMSGRIGYNGMNVTFNESNYYPDFKIDTFGTEMGLITAQYMDAKVSYIELSPILQIHNFLPVKNLYLLAGLEFGIPVKMRYTMTETIYDGTFQNPLPRTLADDDAIPDVGVRTAFAVGLGYMIPLNKNIHLTPEVSFRMPVNNVSANRNFDSWSVPQLRAGLNLTFGFAKKEEPAPAPEKEHELSVRFKDVRYYDNQGNAYPLKSVKVEDVQYSELFPLVPYVFVPENETAPAVENQTLVEKSEIGEFSISKLEPAAISINKSTLDIIGTRLKENPGSEVTITGTIDNKKEPKALALQRAEFAKQYLLDNYNISEERINVRTSVLPEKPSSSTDPDGIMENRRIEISSSSPKILEPIIIESDNQRIADPNMIEFIPEIKSSDPITSWRMEITQADRVLRKNTGTGNPPPAMQWGIQPNELTNRQLPVDYTLTVMNSADLTKTASGTIPVEYISTSRKKSEDLPDKTVSKFSLILFDFDKAEISDADMKIIDKYIVPAIKFNSTVKIFGYTDRIGEENYNRKLAEKRAQAVKDAISSKIKAANVEVFGVGEDVQVFDNDSPIGRHLSRTVQVHVVTPK